jgi:hypothetical protein
MSGAYRRVLDGTVLMVVEYEKNELHRYTRDGGKQAAEVFDRGTLGEHEHPKQR